MINCTAENRNLKCATQRKHDVHSGAGEHKKIFSETYILLLIKRMVRS